MNTDVLQGYIVKNAGAIDALIAESKKRTSGPEITRCASGYYGGRGSSPPSCDRRCSRCPVMVVHLATEHLKKWCVPNERTKGMQKPVRSICFGWQCIFKTDFEGAKIRVCTSIRKKADQDCLWKHWRMIRSRRLPAASVALQWSRKLLVKMISRRFRRAAGSTDERNLLYTYGVRTGSRITQEEQMCRLLSENAAKLYGVYPNKGVIRGSDADIVVFDPEKENVISAKTHLYHTDNNP